MSIFPVSVFVFHNREGNHALCIEIATNFAFWLMTSSEFPTEADLEDFTEAAADEEDEDEEEGEEVVEDRDYYYDSFKGDDYNEENTTEPSSDGTISDKEIAHDVKGNTV